MDFYTNKDIQIPEWIIKNWTHGRPLNIRPKLKIHTKCFLWSKDEKELIEFVYFLYQVGFSAPNAFIKATSLLEKGLTKEKIQKMGMIPL